MRFTISWVLGSLLFAGLQFRISCDYLSLMKCGFQKNCWSHLDEEIVTIIGDNIRNETKPCDNFWYYACGQWKPSGGHHYDDNFGLAMEHYAWRLQEFLMSAFTGTIPRTSTSNIWNLVEKLGSYYQSCVFLNTKYPELPVYLTELAIHSAGLKHWLNLQSVIESNNTWSSDENVNWVEVIADLRRYGLNGVFIAERSTVAFNDSTKIVIEIKIPDEDHNFEKVFEVVNYFVELGLVEGATDHVWDLATQIFDLDQQLMTLRLKHSLDEEATFEESLKLSQLKKKVPNINWQSYFNILLDQPHVEGDMPIEVNGITYLKELALLLSQTDGRIVALYIITHLGKFLRFVRPRNSSKDCLEHMGTLMPLGLNYIYDRFLYEDRQRDESALGTLFFQLKSQFREYINLNKLNLNEAEKQYIQEKVDKMALRLGNLPKKATNEYINRYFDAANITDNFYHNHLEILRFRTTQQHFGFLHNEANLNLETFYIYDDITQIRYAPYFVHERNLLIVPMIFMQLPFFHHSLQPVFQYSLMGFILGHEFNHAFENDGIIMNAEGNESPIGFDIKRKKEFTSNVECFQQNKTMSLVERMADVNGFQLAYDAYFGGSNLENSAENSVDSKSYLNDFTEKQLFFLNFAQFFCGELPEPIDHDRDDVRVNTIANNMPEFRKIFHCEGEQRNLESRPCEMWRI